MNTLPWWMWAGTWLVALVGMANLAVQVRALQRVARQQERAARLQAMTTYMRDVYDVVSPGGSAHDTSESRKVQRALLRQLADELRAMNVNLPVDRNWPDVR
jgi:hypothetical protein